MKHILIAVFLLTILAGCGKNSSVVTTKSGVQYTEDSVGTGPEAKEGDLIVVHFRGWIVKDSSNLFSDWSKDSTRMQQSLGDTRERNTPYKFVLNTEGFVRGSDEAIIGMKKGGTRTIIIPDSCAYGEKGFGPIPPNSMLKIVVTMVDIKEKIEAKMWDVDTSKIVTTPSGLKYIIIKEGTGPMADSGKSITVHYTGFLPDGTKFDSSVERDEPFNLMLGMGMVIPGWDEGLRYMNKGTKARLIIPAHLGYGDRLVGKIPPNSQLIFDLEVIDVK